MVAIDDKTFDDLGLRWPFSRERHADVIDRVRRDGAKVAGARQHTTAPAASGEGYRGDRLGTVVRVRALGIANPQAGERLRSSVRRSD